MAILGPDISHHQGSPNFAQIKAAGHAFTVLKATEGIGYVDPMFTANRKAAHAAGLIVGIYHFARANDPVAEAAYFLGVVGTVKPGEFLVLDWECAYTGDHVAWCKAWLDAAAAATGVRPLIYMNTGEMNARNWMPVSADSALWLAKYDGSPTAPTTCNCWNSAAMKQYTDAGTVPGVAGGCDVNVFYGSTDQLAAYGTTAPQEDDDMYGPDQRNEIVPALYEVVGNARSTNMQVAADAVKIDAILAAVKGEQVDVGALGDRISANLVPAVVTAVAAKVGGAGISKDDVEAAIREVLGSLKGA